ncbi:MAG: sugar ABC transporter permease [Lachnospiraceae bacterium]|nr:sugar ABC transporter permease [Lachnospiraceae bacterium]
MKSKFRKTPWLFILACMLPAIILTFYFIIWPTIQVMWLSLTNARALSYFDAEYIGFKNYTSMFKDKRFVQALQNTLKLLAAAPIITISCSLLLAFMVTQSKLKERGFYRTIFFFPSMLSLSVISIIFSFVFHPRFGLLNGILGALGFEDLANHPWMGDPKTALWTIAAAFIWQSAGYFMVMHIAAIDGISAEIYEAASIDGAGPFRKLFSITLPLIKNIVGITFIFSVSGILDASFTLSSVMTGGGPNGASTVLLSYIYKQGITNGEYGYAMAITAFTLALAIGLAAYSRFVTNRNEKID